MFPFACWDRLRHLDRHRAHSYTLRSSHFSWLVKHIPPSRIFVPHGGGNHHPNIVLLVNPLPLSLDVSDSCCQPLVTTLLVSSLKDVMSEIYSTLLPNCPRRVLQRALIYEALNTVLML